MKVVRFSPTIETIGYTYSSTDYDRSLFSIPDFNSIRKNHSYFHHDTSLSSTIEINHRPMITPLDFSNLSISTSSHSSTTTINSPTNKYNLKKPNLKIDTKMTSDPLFFTHLSTHYHKCNKEFNDDDDSDNDQIY